MTETTKRWADRQRKAQAALEERRARTRFYIRLSLTRSHIGHGRYRRYVWPKLFETEEEAYAFAEANNPFKNSAETAARGRIKSYCIEKKLLPA